MTLLFSCAPVWSFFRRHVYAPLWLVRALVMWSSPGWVLGVSCPMKAQETDGKGSPCAPQESDRESPTTKKSFVGLTSSVGWSGPSAGKPEMQGTDQSHSLLTCFIKKLPWRDLIAEGSVFEVHWAQVWARGKGWWGGGVHWTVNVSKTRW